jgi:hypothetical protein
MDRNDVDGALRSSSCLQAGARWVSLSHRRLAWAESVMGHIQHLILESLVKMDHFQKEPQPLNFKRDHWGDKGGSKGLNSHRRPGMSPLSG